MIIEKPAGWSRRLITRSEKMSYHLLFLLLMIVIFDVKVKIILKKR